MIVKEVAAKSAITKTKLPVADYVANAYIGCPHKCIYCYAEFMKRFTNHCEEWGDFIDIKMFDTIKIPADIANKSITISSVTDPYNNYEIKYKKTRQILEALKTTNCTVGILTKSKNVLRDIALFKEFNNIEVGVSLNTVDDDFRKLIEPAASNVEERINILSTLKEHGIKNWLFMSPMFPFLSDYKKIIERTKSFVDYYGFENLNLRAGYKFKVLKLIEQKYNHLYKHYKNIYTKDGEFFWAQLEKEIITCCEDNKISYRMYFYHEKIKKK